MIRKFWRGRGPQDTDPNHTTAPPAEPVLRVVPRIGGEAGPHPSRPAPEPPVGARGPDRGVEDHGVHDPGAEDPGGEGGDDFGSGRGVLSADVYAAHFGLRERPFSLVPDPEFLFWSQSHQRAKTVLEYGLITLAPITLITGEVGAGKTTLLHHMLHALGDEVTVGLVSNAQGERGELLRWVLLALRQPAEQGDTYVDLFRRFQDFLIAEYAAGRRVVLIFDEAQNLTRESLEELRMFTNVNSNKDELLQLVLVGQPELRDVIRRPDMLQFAQRISASFHLPALGAESIGPYIAHRLSVAGAPDGAAVFSDSAARMIYDATGGVPRLVNRLCDLALLYAFSADLQTVDAPLLREVLEDGVFFATTPVTRD
ncbi:ExeA family protein [Frigidibacter sp. MR17.24]|uniref:ExeA family protein n=1 Tax=Frigidibacter sp. MR17.24 TaxID=3127345 RepID=UPI003012EFD2